MSRSRNSHHSKAFRLSKLFPKYTGWTFFDVGSVRGEVKKRFARQAKKQRRRCLD